MEARWIAVRVHQDQENTDSAGVAAGQDAAGCGQKGRALGLRRGSTPLGSACGWNQPSCHSRTAWSDTCPPGGPTSLQHQVLLTTHK